MLKYTAILGVLLISLTGCAGQLLLFGTVVAGNFVITESETIRQDDIQPALSSDAAPPSAAVVVGEDRFPLQRESYCWETSSGGTCADVMREGVPASYTPLPADTFSIEFDFPQPDRMTVSLYAGGQIAGAPVDSDTLTPPVQVWQPAAPAGDYLLVIDAVWTNDEFPTGDARYTLPVSLP